MKLLVTGYKGFVGSHLLTMVDASVGLDFLDRSDITYVWTQEGWLYLAVVIDLYSRKVVGWSLSSRMKAQLVII